MNMASVKPGSEQGQLQNDDGSVCMSAVMTDRQAHGIGSGMGLGSGWSITVGGLAQAGGVPVCRTS
jgi:hypothetical protein